MSVASTGHRGGQGLPHFIAVTTVGVTDRQGVLDGIENHRAALDDVRAVLVNGGYTGRRLAQGVARVSGG